MKKRIRKSFRPSLEGLETRLVPATIAVNTTLDLLGAPPGVVSLREAIRRANANPGPDTILLPAGTYRISRVGENDNTNFAGDFDVTGSLTIVGQGGTPGATVIQDNADFTKRERLFDVLGSADTTMAFVNLTLDGGGKFTRFGAAVQALTANILLNNCVVSNNLGIKGGAINAEAGRVTLRNSVLKNNIALGNGGAVFSGTGGVVLDNSTLSGNTAGNGRGGAVFVQRGDVAVSHSFLIDNHALVGGAIDDEAGNVSLRNGSSLQLNTATGDGGAIFDLGTVTLSGSSVTNKNHSGTSGGGIAATTAVLTSGSTVSGNSTGGFGGGISAVNVTLTNNSFVSGNTAAGAGGGISAQLTATLTNSTVSGNKAEKGAGIFATTAKLTNSTVRDNRASKFGGGIAAPATTLVGSTVFNNGAVGAGGGIDAATLTMTTSTVSFNQAGGIGGGIHALTATLTRSTVNDNRCALDGAGIFADRVKLTNSTVSGNVASRNGGGILVTQFGDILNSTIAFNHAGVFGGGVMDLDGSVTVKNTIIALNTAGTNFRDVLGLFVSKGHNLVQDPNSGAANTNFTDPLNQDILGVDPKLGALAFNGGPTQTHALLAGSLAIDHGSNVGAPGTDQRGVARPRDGDGNGSLIVDIGAFEK